MPRNGSIHDLLDSTNPSSHYSTPSGSPYHQQLSPTSEHQQEQEEEFHQPHEVEERREVLEYNPNRISEPYSVLIPISKLELIQCESTINPLREHVKPSNEYWYNSVNNNSGSTHHRFQQEESVQVEREKFELPNKPLTVKQRLVNDWHASNGTKPNSNSHSNSNNNNHNNTNNNNSNYNNNNNNNHNNNSNNYHNNNNTHNGFNNNNNNNYNGNKRDYNNREDSNNDYTKRRRPNQDTYAVQSYYNARPETGRDARNNSPIIGLKNFNNWIKSVLIGKFGRRSDEHIKNKNYNNDINHTPPPKIKVFDLGCGKGGDLQKWSRAGTASYVGIDLAAVSVEQARTRWSAMRNNQFEAYFYALDCFSESIAKVIPPSVAETPFDVISMQFCLHYAFESEEKARMMLSNVVRYLKIGGVLIATVPDAAGLLDRLSNLPDSTSSLPLSPSAIEPESKVAEHPLEFGNAVYKIKFDSKDSTPRFGHRYTFFLQDAVEEVPEWVVYWDLFVDLAAEYGLVPSFSARFQDIYTNERSDLHFDTLLHKMKVVDHEGNTEMSIDQWEACNLYLGIVFTKTSESPPHLLDPDHPPPESQYQQKSYEDQSEDEEPIENEYAEHNERDEEFAREYYEEQDRRIEAGTEDDEVQNSD